MRKAILFVILSSICNLVSLSMADDVSSSRDKISSEEYKVYSDAIPQLLGLPEAKGLFVIYDHTTIDSFDQQSVAYFEKRSGIKLEKDMIERFRAKNKMSYKLENNFIDSLQVVLISEEEINHIFKNGKGWDDFYKKYPHSHGIITLSRVAFNNDKNIAFLHFGNQRDWFAGIGYYVLLKKEDNRWVIVAKVITWIS